MPGNFIKNPGPAIGFFDRVFDQYFDSQAVLNDGLFGRAFVQFLTKG